MQWFNNLRLRAKLLATFGLVLALAAGSGLFAVRQLAVVNDQATVIADSWLPSVEKAGAMNTTASGMRITQWRHVASSTEDQRRDAERTLAEQDGKLAAQRKAYEPLITSDEERRAYEQFGREWAAYTAQWEKVARLSRQNRNAEAAAVMRGDAKQAFDAASGTLETIVDMNTKGAAAASATGDAIYASSRHWIFGAIALNLALGLGAAFYLSARLAGTVRAIADRAGHLQTVCVAGLRGGLEAMGRGDLNVTVVPKTTFLDLADRDELGELARSVDGIIRDTQATVAVYTAMQQTLGGVVAETQELTAAALAGRLDQRGRPERFAGAYRDMVAGLNGTLDALQAPFGEAAAVMQRVAARDLTARMTGQYKGDHAAIQAAVNTDRKSVV